MSTEAVPQPEWVPACGGTEAPFTTRTGRRLLYMWNPTTGEHAYYAGLNAGSPSADEATAALAMHCPAVAATAPRFVAEASRSARTASNTQGATHAPKP